MDTQPHRTPTNTSPTANTMPSAFKGYHTTRRFIVRYSLAIAIVVVITGLVSVLRLTLIGYLATIQLLYMVGVLFVAVIIGTGPAVLAALLSFLYASYFIAEPRYTFLINNPEEAVRLIAFLTAAVLVGSVAASAREQAARAQQLAAEAAHVQALKESDRLKTAILSSVSHDFRTPLTAIRGAVDELTISGIEWPPEYRQQLLGTISEQARRLQHLIDNLLDLSRIQSGAVHPRKDWYSLDEVIQYTIVAIQPRMVQHPLILRLPAEMPLIPLDFVLTGQVLTNLLLNAATHTPPGTAVTVEVHFDATTAHVTVADIGPGIAPEDAERIFEAFYRPGKVDDTRGSGVGLAICRGFVEAQGGQIWAEANLDGGARFVFTLPRTLEETL
ncbi:MAG: DUF4118 domain-containing protein [Chloroflexaceae bacterium]|nr:DUF4118 domain-containing protein [Chloroflexaceae bacterium]NJO05802.1 DUF4118 domain-containing protein [Chloroflexaceae bacterium]